MRGGCRVNGFVPSQNRVWIWGLGFVYVVVVSGTVTFVGFQLIVDVGDCNDDPCEHWSIDAGRDGTGWRR